MGGLLADSKDAVPMVLHNQQFVKKARRRVVLYRPGNRHGRCVKTKKRAHQIRMRPLLFIL